MSQLNLAIQYLNKRAVSTIPCNKKLMNQFTKVLPASEVNAVLLMVEKGEFSDFYETMKSKSHPDFI
jgi:hypothetical protein